MTFKLKCFNKLRHLPVHFFFIISYFLQKTNYNQIYIFWNILWNNFWLEWNASNKKRIYHTLHDFCQKMWLYKFLSHLWIWNNLSWVFLFKLNQNSLRRFALEEAVCQNICTLRLKAVNIWQSYPIFACKLFLLLMSLSVSMCTCVKHIFELLESFLNFSWSSLTNNAICPATLVLHPLFS